MPTRATAMAAGGIVLHLAVGVFPYAASGLLAPPSGVAVLALVWVALLALAGRLASTGHGARVALVPVAALALWFAVMAFGDLVLGWTA